jgi:glycosyltransferase involved in cell wall biosynthesis
MDLNPDQLIAMKKIGPRSVIARVLEGVNRWILWRSDLIIALDRFMAERLEQRNPKLREKMLVLPPWPHEEHIAPAGDASTNGANPFRERYNLAGKFVVMYSGNHSPSNPLDTILEAAKELRDDDSIRFLFVGGGIGKPRVEEFIRAHDLKHAMSLPYQPLSELKHSLGAADVHVVSLGQEMVGIIHPCKIYGAMAAARPILFLGPKPSHITDLLDAHDLGWHVAHGDVNGAVSAIRSMREMSGAKLSEMGNHAQVVLQQNLSQQRLCGAMCDRVEATIFGAK